MNERFKALLKEAGFTNFGPDIEKKFEKLNELLVKECSNQLDDGAEDGMWARGVLHKYFGVKE